MNAPAPLPELSRQEKVFTMLGVLLGMLLALVLCWLPWILLVSSAETWL